MKRKSKPKVNKKPVSIKKKYIPAQVKRSYAIKEKEEIVNNEVVNENLQNIQHTVITPIDEPLKTVDSDSMLHDLLIDTDKDIEPGKDKDIMDEQFEREQEKDNYEQAEEKFETENNSAEPNLNEKENLVDKIGKTINSESEDWQNPTDFKKMCAVNAMLYVEGGAILLSFLGQAISGDWSKEAEEKYSPSEERKKLIRAPLAKKMELNRDQSKRTPTGAMITAIIFTALPIIIVAVKDRKNRKKMEIQNIELIRLREQNSQLTNAFNELQQTKVAPTYKEPIHSPFIVKTRGRHKKDCSCDKCNLKRTKTKR